MDSRLQQHHHVFADNFFTSVHLANDLLQAGTYLCGTTRATRQEFPRTIPHAALRPGESVKWTDESEVMVCNWKDKRDVYLIASNDAGGDVVKHVQRKHHDVDLAVPTCIQVNGWCRPARSDAGLLRGGTYWSSLVEISILGSDRRRHYQCSHLVENHKSPAALLPSALASTSK